MESNIPKHIGIIMDGNRRWAKAHGLPTLEGHRRGYERMKKVSGWALDRGVHVLTFWAFSTENWNRSKKEVSYLMNLFRRFVRRDVDQFMDRNIKLQFLGRLGDLPEDMQFMIKDAMRKTKENSKGLLNIAFNYGGRAEIIDAVKKIIDDGVDSLKLTESFFRKYLYDPLLPEPDLIIRTSGEQRHSGFMLWESAYSEYYYSKKNWPAFSEKDLDAAIVDYQQRQRRFGG